MEDKIIKYIDSALESLQRDEEQIMKELDGLKGRHKFENGKFIEPKEVTQYKEELGKIREEIGQKTLERRRATLMKEKKRLSDGNLVKVLKNMYKNEKNVDKMINDMLEQRKTEIDIKLNEVEKDIEDLEKRGIKRLDIDKIVKDTQEISDESTQAKKEKIVNWEELIKKADEENLEEESIHDEEETITPEEEIIQDEEEIEDPPKEASLPDEDEEKAKKTMSEKMDEEIKKINQVQEEYEKLENAIGALEFKEIKDEIESLQSEFGKIKANNDELLRRKQIASTIKSLITTDYEQAKREYQAYEKESAENELKLNETKKSITDINEEYEKVESKIETIKREKHELIKEIFNYESNEEKKIQKYYSFILKKYEKISEQIKEDSGSEWIIFKGIIETSQQKLDQRSETFIKRQKLLGDTASTISLEELQQKYEEFKEDYENELNERKEILGNLESLCDRAEQYQSKVSQFEEGYKDFIKYQEGVLKMVCGKYYYIPVVNSSNAQQKDLAEKVQSDIKEAKMEISDGDLAKFYARKEDIAANADSKNSIKELFDRIEGKLEEDQLKREMRIKILMDEIKEGIVELEKQKSQEKDEPKSEASSAKATDNNEFKGEFLEDDEFDEFDELPPEEEAVEEEFFVYPPRRGNREDEDNRNDEEQESEEQENEEQESENFELEELDENGDETKKPNVLIRAAKKSGRGVIGVARWGNGLLNKLSEMIAPMEYMREEMDDEETEEHDIEEIYKFIEEGDDEFDSITGEKRVLSFEDRAKRYREEQKVPESQMKPRQNQKNSKKDKKKNKQQEGQDPRE